LTSTAQPTVPEGRKAHPEHLGHVIFITAAAAMGGFLFGYDSSVINGAVEAIRSRYDVGSAVLAQVIAVALIGCAIGAATAGRVADRIGRRWRHRWRSRSVQRRSPGRGRRTLRRSGCGSPRRHR